MVWTVGVAGRRVPVLPRMTFLLLALDRQGLPTLTSLNGEPVSRTGMTITSQQPMFELLSTGGYLRSITTRASVILGV